MRRYLLALLTTAGVLGPVAWAAAACPRPLPPCEGTTAFAGSVRAGAAGPARCATTPPTCRDKQTTTSNRGARGLRGVLGRTGATGRAGATGAQGDAGAIGATGAAGATGDTGAQGTAGARGATGEIGVTGTTGATGATGAQGIRGVQGEVGAAGATGATGATVPRGDVGTTGATKHGDGRAPLNVPVATAAAGPRFTAHARATARALPRAMAVARAEYPVTGILRNTADADVDRDGESNPTRSP